MRPGETRSGFITRTGVIISTDELDGTRRLLTALTSVGIAVSMDTALRAFRAFQKCPPNKATPARAVTDD